jgi:hypothetical protein
MIALKKAQIRERPVPTVGCFFQWFHRMGPDLFAFRLREEMAKNEKNAEILE